MPRGIAAPLYDIPTTLDVMARYYLIWGWSSDPSKPLKRYGMMWIKHSRQTKAFFQAALAMCPGERRFLPFKTAVGEISYELERVK